MDAAVLQVMQNYPDVVTNIEWHVWWPGAGDPFYLHNTGPVINRKNWYPFNGVPHVRIDGTQRSGSYAAMTSYIDMRLDIESPLEIDVSGLIVGGSPTGTCEISVDVTVETPVSGTNYRLFVASIEKYIAQAGTWYNVFRWINNNDGFPNGESIDLSTTGLQHFDVSLPFHSIYQDEEMAVVAWVQNYSGTKEVLQADEATLLMPYYVGAHHVGPAAKIAGADELVSFAAEIDNLGANEDTYDLTVTGVPASWAYSYTTPAGTFSGPSTLTLASLETGAITFVLDSQGNAGPGEATLGIASQNVPANTASLDFTKINGVQVLLVDDDLGESREEHVTPGLDAAGVTYAVYDRGVAGLTTNDLTDAAEVVFWMCGSALPSSTEPTLDPADRAALGAYIDAGGKLFVTGADVSYDLCDSASPNHTAAAEQWFEDYMHATYGFWAAFSQYFSGTAGDPIGDGLTNLMLTTWGPTNQLSPDGILPTPDADLVFDYDGGDWNAGVRWDDGSAKVVFFAFGIEGVNNVTARNTIIARIIDWFGATVAVESPQGSAPLVRLAQNVPNPFRPSTTIQYELTTAGAVDLRVFDVNGRLVRHLVSENQAAVEHSVQWDGINENGQLVASGVYFYRLETPGARVTRRMVLSH